jgi:diacylglycerol kinase family enzyme
MEVAPITLEPLALEPLGPPEELIVIRNPVSANSARAQRQITDLQTQFPFRTVDVYPTLHDPAATSEENRQANQQRVLDLLQERIDPNDPSPQRSRLWLVVATGDGTIRDTAEALLTADDAIRSIPILPLAGGGGNDVSSMAHGFWGKRRPAQRLPQAHIEPVNPLECTIENEAGTTIKYALGYLSAGEIIARAAYTIDQDRGSGRIAHLINEKLLAIDALIKASPFTVLEQGVKRETFDLIFANGPRMAKFLHWQQQLRDPQFTRSEVTKKDLLNITATGIRLAIGRQPSAVVPDGNRVRFQTTNEAWIQLDGEASALPARSTVTVRRSQKSVNVVHLRKYTS